MLVACACIELFGRRVAVKAFLGLAFGRYGILWSIGAAAGALVTLSGDVATAGPLLAAGAVIAAVVGEASAGAFAYGGDFRKAAWTRAWTRCLTLGVTTGAAAIALLEGSGSGDLRLAAGVGGIAIALRTIAAETYADSKAALASAEDEWANSPNNDERMSTGVDCYNLATRHHDGLVVARTITGMLMVMVAGGLLASTVGLLGWVGAAALALIVGAFLVKGAEDEHDPPEPLRFPRGHANDGERVLLATLHAERSAVQTPPIQLPQSGDAP